MAKVAKADNKVTLPQNSYVLTKDGEKHFSDDYIIKRTPFIGSRLLKDLFVYAPKGLHGSRNSNFHEYLSMGLIPYITGSATLIALFNLANKHFAHQDKLSAGLKGTKMAAGVILYGVGKWLGNKLITKGVKAKTGIDTDMSYKKIVKEFPDYKGDTKLVAVEYHKVFESVDFPRWDLLYKMGEKKGNRYEYYDKIAKKMGYKEKLNSPDQTTQSKIKETVTKSIAAKSISSFLWAALGVAIGSQEPFGNILKPAQNLASKTKMQKVGVYIWKFVKALKNSTVNLFKGTIVKNAGTGKPIKSAAAGVLGKTLIFAAVGSTILGILNATRGFKVKKHNGKPQINYKKEVVEG